MSAPTIVAGLKHLLAEHLPFSAMAPDDLDFLIASVAVGYYAPGEVILSPSAAVPSHCVIVKQGLVQGHSAEAGLAYEAGVGDCFPVGALLADRSVTLTYRAVGDTFCLLLPHEKFHQLVKRSTVFLDFCTRRLGSMLDLARQQLQQSYATEANAERTMSTPVGELARKPALTCAPNASLRDVFERMQGAHVGSIVVVDSAADDERAVGILTRSDLLGRVVLPGVALSSRISEVMTPDPKTLDATSTAADATLMMAEHSIRHIPVVQTIAAGRRVIGVVSERDLFGLQRLGVRQLSAAIRRASHVESLVAIAADIRRLSHHLVAQGVTASHLTRLISHLNDQLTVRLLTLIAHEMAVQADSFCWLSFGSEGREEQTIATDQDNGIAYEPEDVARERLLELADRANRALDACGFPLCKGNIMAGNPQWCLTYPQWQSLFNGWIDQGHPDALLKASIFFDFRPLFGNLTLGERLRTHVVERAANARFLKQMADNALRNRAPSGGALLGALFAGDASTKIDLKMNGTVPFVDAARIWSYQWKLTETNTSARFARLAELGRLPEADVRGWIAAFEFFQLLRLRQQHRRSGDASADDNPNRVDLEQLSALDRRVINESFRQARKMQQRLQLDFPG